MDPCHYIRIRRAGPFLDVLVTEGLVPEGHTEPTLDSGDLHLAFFSRNSIIPLRIVRRFLNFARAIRSVSP